MAPSSPGVVLFAAGAPPAWIFLASGAEPGPVVDHWAVFFSNRKPRLPAPPRAHKGHDGFATANADHETTGWSQGQSPPAPP